MKNRHGKFNAHKVEDDGYTFDSKAEHRRYCDLKILQRAGEIEALEVHPVFTAVINGVSVCNIILDFKYFDLKKNRLIYEDVKSKPTFTAISRLKHKILKAIHPDVVVLLVGLK